MTNQSTEPSAELPNLEKKLFEYLCIIQCVLLLCLIIQDIILFGFSWIILADIVVSAIGLLFFYLSRYRGIFNPLRIPIILFMMTAIVFFWVSLGGYSGLLSVIALAIGLVIIFIAPVKNRLIYASVIPLEIVILTVLQSSGIIETGEYPPAAVPLNYVLFSLSTLSLAYLMKVEFDSERSKREQQNNRLNELNYALKTTISEKEDYIEKLSSTQVKLVESEKMATLGRLTAGLAHELNNPLNFISGSVVPIQNDLAEIKEHLTAKQYEQLQPSIEEASRLLENIKEGSQRSTDVINNLLRISPKNRQQDLTEVDVSELTKRTCLLIENAFPQISISFDSKEESVCLANHTEINQVLLNLLNNATEAVKKVKNPKIKVTVSNTATRVKIIIIDNGKGVAQKHRHHIFEPFFTTKEEGRGTGLGLYISYGIIKKHDGDLSYLHKPKGACFEIDLPLI